MPNWFKSGHGCEGHVTDIQERESENVSHS